MAWGVAARRTVLRLYSRGAAKKDIMAALLRSFACDEASVRRCLSGLALLDAGVTDPNAYEPPGNVSFSGEAKQKADLVKAFRGADGTGHYLSELQRAYEAHKTEPRPAPEQVQRHLAGLLCYGQLLRDRLIQLSVVELINGRTVGGLGALWSGGSATGDQPSPPCVEIERHWGVEPYDALRHPACQSFKAHLDGHAAWPCLAQVVQASDDCVKTFGRALHVARQAVCRRLPALEGTDLDAFVSSLVVHAALKAMGQLGLEFPYRLDRSSEHGQLFWRLPLGAWSVGHAAAAKELQGMVAVHRALARVAPHWSAMKRLAQSIAEQHTLARRFKGMLGSDESIERLLRDGFCELCP